MVTGTEPVVSDPLLAVTDLSSRYGELFALSVADRYAVLSLGEIVESGEVG